MAIDANFNCSDIIGPLFYFGKGTFWPLRVRVSPAVHPRGGTSLKFFEPEPSLTYLAIEPPNAYFCYYATNLCYDQPILSLSSLF